MFGLFLFFSCLSFFLLSLLVRISYYSFFDSFVMLLLFFFCFSTVPPLSQQCLRFRSLKFVLSLFIFQNSSFWVWISANSNWIFNRQKKKKILRFIACKKRNKQTFTFQDRMTNGLFVAHRFAIRLINIFFPSLRLLELSLSLLLYNGSPCHWQFFFSSSQLADRKPVILHLNSWCQSRWIRKNDGKFE